VAQHLARYRPDLVATLTSVSSVCRRSPEERAAVLDRLQTAENNFSASASASLRRWFDHTDVDPEQVRRTEATLMANDAASFLHCYRVFATADAEIELDRIPVPALAVTGENDPGSTPEMARRLAAAMPDCRAVIVPGARHMLPVERPRELVDCLSTFIGEYAHV
jgi:(E)-2-((N-methylformamido)methylene)succinate hydrolase